jgi:hypothetical protein
MENCKWKMCGVWRRLAPLWGEWRIDNGKWKMRGVWGRLAPFLSFSIRAKRVCLSYHYPFIIFHSRVARNGAGNRIYNRRLYAMRLKRQLEEDVWYEVRTGINVGEPLFRLGWAMVLFYRVLREAKGQFKFEMRGLVIEGVWLTFYIKPEDGFKLPKIMQCLKQTFSVRFNFRTGRTRTWREWIMDN